MNLAQHNLGTLDFQELIDAIDESLPVGLYIMNCEGIFLYGNQALCKIFKVEGKVKGLSFSDFLPAENRERLMETFCTQEPTTINPVQEKVHLNLVPGRTLITLIKAIPYQLADQNVVIVGTVQDITDEEQLRLKRDAVDRIVLHDLKNPLSGFLGLSQLLRREFASIEEVKNFSFALQKQGMRLLRLMETQLALGRVESDQFQLIQEPIDFLQIWNEALEDWVSEEERQQKDIDLLIAENFWEHTLNTHIVLLRVILGQVLRFGFDLCPPNQVILAEAGWKEQDFYVEFKVPYSSKNVTIDQPLLLQQGQWDQFLSVSLWLVQKAMQRLNVTLETKSCVRCFSFRLVVASGALEEISW